MNELPQELGEINEAMLRQALLIQLQRSGLSIENLIGLSKAERGGRSDKNKQLALVSSFVREALAIRLEEETVGHSLMPDEFGRFFADQISVKSKTPDEASLREKVWRLLWDEYVREFKGEQKKLHFQKVLNDLLTIKDENAFLINLCTLINFFPNMAALEIEHFIVDLYENQRQERLPAFVTRRIEALKTEDEEEGLQLMAAVNQFVIDLIGSSGFEIVQQLEHDSKNMVVKELRDTILKSSDAKRKKFIRDMKRPGAVSLKRGNVVFDGQALKELIGFLIKYSDNDKAQVQVYGHNITVGELVRIVSSAILKFETKPKIANENVDIQFVVEAVKGL
ncbi:MAG: hypothetical protein UR28_C0002G0055 [Candidatus Peregrinibacteria bacterium GW2011_GWF2_33_10]|nr:MAG: hypothetical protein UR28_C0002G0055 [Candidatus Peregrinibacteria bacterium GW2011_GWF2_33_10]OGJ45632.1 MAG: hypothetical protein A2263_00845 [Candidatus Peregrinibacteria bacterium RIFOXYA2_FULL_33_21]OGJ46571.1 MAG: hypothetical protein A2272_06460 [Candidatus Peregrinibacteria bacterium RIFOXYA12_FULL_33_12]OGJ51223.1 MAG: hypothetical protein A2307_01225 [Candidatus Peregrinibacteria bacterium RIFOXYB2_FULL_33_20]